jgi:hypothetical protein
VCFINRESIDPYRDRFRFRDFLHPVLFVGKRKFQVTVTRARVRKKKRLPDLSPPAETRNGYVDGG